MDIDEDKRVIPYHSEYMKHNRFLESCFRNITEEVEASERKVDLLTSKMIDLARYPDFTTGNVAEHFNEVMSGFDSMTESEKRLVIYLLLGFLNNMYFDTTEE